VNRLEPGRPSALIVDFGGVMTVAEDDVFGAFCRETGADPARLRTIVAGAFDGSDPDGLVARRERGQIPLEEFERALAAALSDGLSKPIDPAGLHGRLFAAERLDAAMVGVVRTLRDAGIATAMLSNTWGDGTEQDALGDLFDAVVLSGRVGLRKPEPGIFLAATDALGVQPGACVFVDDIAANVEAAQRVGMTGVVHGATGSTIGALEVAFGIALVHRDAPPVR
jgi:putative hydrolase of the HAD superfamily